MSQPIRFQNGAQYDEFMGEWSRLAGEHFLKWLVPQTGARWADVGCGNGAFTQIIIEQAQPLSIEGIDPSPEQIEFARSSSAGELAHFQQGDAMALPFADDCVDVAVMALVLFFVPEPARGVAEMCRVVRPGGWVTAYTWDILEGGFPYDAVFAGLEAHGLEPTFPPSAAISRMQATQELWQKAGLQNIETSVITVRRSFDSFEQFWRLANFAPGLADKLDQMSHTEHDALVTFIRNRLNAENGVFEVVARANAIKGQLAG